MSLIGSLVFVHVYRDIQTLCYVAEILGTEIPECVQRLEDCRFIQVQVENRRSELRNAKDTAKYCVRLSAYSQS